MNDWIVPLASPRLRDKEIEAMIAAYRSGWWTMGPETDLLEQELGAYTGAEHAIAVSSCSAALHLALLGLGVGAGDAVVLPSINFAAAANMVVAVGARPVFAEISSPTEPWLDPAAVAEELERGAGAVLNVAYGGHPGATAELVELASQHDAILIEDVAHAAGSFQAGRHLGTLGRAGAMSFSASKNLAIGEGGMLITSDSRLAADARSRRWHGISASTAERHAGATASYDVDRLGFNYRFGDPRAAAVRGRLRRLDADNDKRAALVAAYREALASEPRLDPTAPPPQSDPNSFCMFTAVVADGIDRDRVQTLLAERGVQTSMHFPPLHLTSAYRSDASPLPRTESFASRALTLPLFPEMSEDQMALVLDSLGRALRESERPQV